MANTVNVQNLVHTYIKKHNLSGQRINYNNLELTLDPTTWRQTNLDVGIKMWKKVINVNADNTQSTLTIISHAESFLEINSGILAGNYNGATMQPQIKYPQEIGRDIWTPINLNVQPGAEGKPPRQRIDSHKKRSDDKITWNGTGRFQIQPAFTMYQGLFCTKARLSGNVRVGGYQLPIEEIARNVGVPKHFVIDGQSISWYVHGTAEIILENVHPIMAN